MLFRTDLGKEGLIQETRRKAPDKDWMMILIPLHPEYQAF